uniref:C2H2-type domain-containing protein n=1 Tax=Periophthalmus magnuspinnatus TaxID=409849 RepID=A0A3B4BAG0_9GOBI
MMSLRMEEEVFTQLLTLQHHMKLHTGESDYKCDKCGKGFTTVSNRNAHKKIHTEEGPFECDQCGKAFSTARKLSRHRRVHKRGKVLSLYHV